MRLIFLLSLIFSFSPVLAGPGGTGGGPITPSLPQQTLKLAPTDYDRIDNIEIDNEVKFPETLNEKIEMLKNSKIQSIQFIDGEIVSYL